MAKQKRGGSCLGLFIKSFLVVFIVLGGLTALGVLIAVHFFGVDQALWTQVTAWNSYPLIATYVVVLLSGMTGFGVAAMGAVVSALFSKGEKSAKGEGSARAKRPRPKSNRKTTL